jgi:hypothetical protein
MGEWQTEIVREIDPAGLVVCPVGALVGDPHAYEQGRGVLVPWDIAGDSRHVVEVCASCAEDSVS